MGEKNILCICLFASLSLRLSLRVCLSLTRPSLQSSHQSVLVQLVRGHEPLGEALVHEQSLHVQHLAAPPRATSPAALAPPAEVPSERPDRLGDLLPVKLDLHLSRRDRIKLVEKETATSQVDSGEAAARFYRHVTH